MADVWQPGAVEQASLAAFQRNQAVPPQLLQRAVYVHHGKAEEDRHQFLGHGKFPQGKLPGGVEEIRERRWEHLAGW